MDGLVAAGLGLARGTVRLERVTAAWIAAGEALREGVSRTLGDAVAGVEVVGSASVPGLLAKPIVDLAAGVQPDQEPDPVAVRLASAGWLYQGDAGDDGGLVFVLESGPGHRVAHLHVVPFGGRQWRNYLCLRDLLRRSPEARLRYETVKRDLHRRYPEDRAAYTNGKGDVVAALLSGADPR
ncbi:GrpB family protein [Catenuloplanes indicus]|uniref:GrpB-like predicted nucleotidyltransferase (UPF0157 family) n=1 Tax=Catenuloplanes indicus TaxID=137267 RepID=A0AAE4B175_9ACTN|nr:GrpB family protein [Catenuloplanes indicus]MDQ0371130.1 GrpB-like predicted nucleotidyltransferase (UPF0157 family) [Catenuloplanes indicus]